MKDKTPDNLHIIEWEGEPQDEGGDKQRTAKETHEDTADWAEKIVDGPVGQRGDKGNEGDGTEESERRVGAGAGKEDKEDGNGSHIEEDERSHDEVSLEGNFEDCDERCSVCYSGGLVYICGECNSWLHEPCP